jgi:hypothetical protein
VDFESELKLLLLSFFLLGAFSTWAWARRVMPTQARPWLPTTAYLLAPYLWTAIFYRGNIGEVMIYALFPCALLLFELNLQAHFRSPFSRLGLTFILILTMFFLAHNVMVLILTPILLLYFSLRLQPWCRHRLAWRHLGIIFALALGLSLWFWLPALLEKSHVVLDNVDLSQQYAKHFLNFGQLWNLSFHHGFSYLGSVDGLSFTLGLILSSALLTSIWQYFLPQNRLCPKNTQLLTLLLLLVALLIFLQLPFSAWVYQLLPFANFIQFPWRFGLPLALLLVALVTFFPPTTRRQKYFYIVKIAGQILLQAQSLPLDFFHQTQDDYLTYPQSTTTNHENTPRTFTFLISEKTTDQPIIFSGQGEISNLTINHTSQKNYQLSCASETCLVIEPTAYFPGFITTATAPDRQLRFAQAQDFTNNQQIGGRLAFSLPAGDWQITTRFTEHTLPRLIGDTLSLLCLLIIIYNLIHLCPFFKSLKKPSPIFKSTQAKNLKH